MMVLRILFLFFIFCSAFKWPLEQTTHTHLSNSHFFPWLILSFAFARPSAQTQSQTTEDEKKVRLSTLIFPVLLLHIHFECVFTHRQIDRRTNAWHKPHVVVPLNYLSFKNPKRNGFFFLRSYAFVRSSLSHFLLCLQCRPKKKTHIKLC